MVGEEVGRQEYAAVDAEEERHEDAFAMEERDTCIPAFQDMRYNSKDSKRRAAREA